MTVVHTIEELKALSLHDHALVPTMGALHEGHLSLIRGAASLRRTVVVSIFVNPTQFLPNEDLSRYPRQVAEDVKKAESAGAGVAFVPSVEEMYSGSSTVVHVPEVSVHYEGAIRPGHFDGVATVVTKLFNIVQPSVAVFGQKDLQQCAVIQKLVRDLNIPVSLSFLPTVREGSGLALSSRNSYLSARARASAALLFECLSSTRARLLEHSNPTVELDHARTNLVDGGFLVDYFDLVDIKTFRSTLQVVGNSALIGAVRIEDTRLIDNVLLFDGLNVP